VLVSGSYFLFQPLAAGGPAAPPAPWPCSSCSPHRRHAQLLGGYPAQLNLNNSGVYYDVYYVHPQEWRPWTGWPASGHVADRRAGRQRQRPLHLQDAGPHRRNQVITNYYPTLLRQSTWVLIGTSTDQTGVAWFGIDGDLTPYRYPMGSCPPTRTWCTTMVAPGSTSEGR